MKDIVAPFLATSGTQSNSTFVRYLFSSAVADAILPIFYIFIPVFAVTLGANAIEIGLVGGAAYATYSFMPFIMGHFSDRRGSRKFFILSSFVILGLVSLSYSLVQDPVSLIIMRVFEGVGWAMLWPAIEAAVTESSVRDSKRSLRIFNYTWSLGAALGPGIGTLLVTLYSYRFAFFTSSVLFLILIALNGVALFRERAPFAVNEKMKVSLLGSMRSMLLSEDKERNFRVWTSLATTSLSAVTSGVFFTFFGPYATSIGVSVLIVGLIATTYGFVRFFTYLALTRELLFSQIFDSSRRNKTVIMFASLASFSGVLILVKDPTSLVYFISFTLFAIGYSIVYSISQTTLIAETKPELKGAGAGLFESSIGLGAALGPVIAGAISSSSLLFAFMVPTGGLVFVLVLLFLLRVT
ncbi:MAG: MFS transporter [Nitrososphaerales archaeon]